MLRVRAAEPSDHAAFIALAAEAGPGFTSLSLGAEALGEKLANSQRAFAGAVCDKADALYQLILDDAETGAVLGLGAVKAEVGVKKPYYDFKIFTIAQASRQADRRFDMDAMVLVNDFAGASEIGSLFVHDRARGRGAGRLIAQSRYMLIAADPSRFGELLVSELRGVVDGAGNSPFFEHVTRAFFQMSFTEADRLSAATDNQFILDLMPKYPIYTALLPEPARAVIGENHPQGAGARRLLEWEGFEFHRYIDIFDGGPLLSAKTAKTRTLRESRVVTVTAANAGRGEARALISNDRIDGFRCVYGEISVNGQGAQLPEAVLRALDLSPGEPARIWMNGAGKGAS